MADDLSSFIENQKNNLEKERAELTRDGNYNFTSQDRQVKKHTHNDRKNTKKTAFILC